MNNGTVLVITQALGWSTWSGPAFGCKSAHYKVPDSFPGTSFWSIGQEVLEDLATLPLETLPLVITSGPSGGVVNAYFLDVTRPFLAKRLELGL